MSVLPRPPETLCKFRLVLLLRPPDALAAAAREDVAESELEEAAAVPVMAMAGFPPAGGDLWCNFAAGRVAIVVFFLFVHVIRQIVLWNVFF